MILNRIVVITLQVEGVHKWKEAKEKCPKSAFLAKKHRHMFHVHATKVVSHSDRDVEFTELKRDIRLFLMNEYPRYSADIRIIDFKGRSCEMIAEELANQFGLTQCIVLEDGENGGGVICN